MNMRHASLSVILLITLSGAALAGPSGYPMPDSNAADLEPQTLSKITPGLSFSEIVRIAGVPHADFCSGVSCYAWFVADGRILKVWPGEPDAAPHRVELLRCSSSPCNRDQPFSR